MNFVFSPQSWVIASSVLANQVEVQVRVLTKNLKYKYKYK